MKHLKNPHQETFSRSRVCKQCYYDSPKLAKCVLTGTVSYLVTNLLAPKGLKHSQINEGNLHDPGNQIKATNSLHSGEGALGVRSTE